MMSPMSPTYIPNTMAPARSVAPQEAISVEDTLPHMNILAKLDSNAIKRQRGRPPSSQAVDHTDLKRILKIGKDEPSDESSEDCEGD